MELNIKIKLSVDPETRKEYELRAKALSDERSRLEDAKEEGTKKGILKVFKRLIASGMSLEYAAIYTPYTPDELKEMLESDI